jgi:hypothetical protein
MSLFIFIERERREEKRREEKRREEKRRGGGRGNMVPFLYEICMYLS